ncbi:hypothetical protein BDV38DRAFT_295906 [Aspergillus pseudotamarii]|uniref:Uncharacterized protein n=1 Tax=Aspergillus pseudotamarii TaxID=132259 RepID=A0A5N6SIL6_ASPPS|nr:uncharacterized protein BDV38DRAFT_295906 [Aspergillus pseudotamarii]KAE8133739.1 hypothetical protein BDV38DRAFT_295906 [Aspergillus pseudotamarii]
MTEKPDRKSSLMGSLQILRSTFGVRHEQWELEDNKDIPNESNTHREARRSNPLPPLTTSVCHSSQWQPIVHTCRQTFMPLSEKTSSTCSNSNNNPRGLDSSSSKLQEQESNLRAQHKASSSQCQTSLRYSSTQLFSRIPTPAKSPVGDLFSHEVYRKEGRRRSVLPSLGRQCVDVEKDADTVYKANLDNEDERKDFIRRKDTQRLSSERNMLDTEATSNRSLQIRTHHQRSSDGQRAITGLSSGLFSNSIHAAKYTPVPCVTVLRTGRPRNLVASPDARSRPATRLFDPISALISRLETRSQRNDCTKNGHLRASNPISGSAKVPPLRKERVEYHTVPKGKLPTHHPLLEDFQPANSKVMDSTLQKSDKMEYVKKSLRWTNGFENLKLETRTKTDSFSPASRPKALSRSATRLSPLPDTGNPRHRDQIGRMVLSRNHPNGFRSKLKKPGLTIHADCVSQVSESQPQQYWLGRFVTLVNAFHYEDSFNEPDIATGFGMLSSYSRPLGHPDSSEADYRIKRAFMVLENVCMNDEASASLRRFRYEYINKFGDGWMV